MLRAVFLGVALVALFVACIGYALLTEIARPASDSATPTEIVVEAGDTTGAIATKLRAAGLIRQPLLFSLLVRYKDLDEDLQAGRYVLQPNMTMSQIIAALQTSRVEEVQVQILEGLRIEEIAEVIGSAELAQVDERAFLAAARDGDTFKPGHFLLSSLPEGGSLEGYLFPDTYRFAATATVTEVIETMLTNFDEKYKSFETEVRVSGDYTVHDIVTMASIVQREAAREDEMPRIAAVFWNRLEPGNQAEVGGRLGADPTVQYVLGQPGNWWPKLDTLSVDELNGLSSPYNTRANPGLPPGPISSPGLAALRAAAQPDESAPYLYFVASCTTPGAHNFATTFDEFQRFEQEYLSCAQR